MDEDDKCFKLVVVDLHMHVIFWWRKESSWEYDLEVARFKRPGKTHSSKAVEGQYKPNSRVRIPNPSESKSYASAVNGEEKRNTSTTQRSDLKSIMLNDSDLIKVEESTKVELVKVQEVGTMNAVHRLYDVMSEEATNDKEEEANDLEEKKSLCDDNVNEIGLHQVEVSIEEKQQELNVEVKSTHTEEKKQEIEVERKVSYMDDDQEGKSYEVETDPSCPPRFEFLMKLDMHDQQSCEYSNTSKWTNSDDTFFMINVYGPHDTQAKVLLWNTLCTFIMNHARKYLLFGDLNEVINESERFGSLFSRPDAQCFNSFIDETNLVEIPDLKATVLERGKSDHNPILLHVEKTDYGPYPFKFFHSWLIRPDFDSMMKEVLADSSTSSVTGTRLKDRLKLLKATDLERKERLKLLQECKDLDRISGMDLTQKAHSHWDIEGDENTKYFHRLINQRRSQQMVKGVMIEGVWRSDPVQLDKDASVEEIKNAVWDCGSSKAPGPDGFLFLFLKMYWDLLKDDVVEFISSFLTSGQMSLGDKWRGWIRACLQSARTSILVNGSPTKEFSIKRGLRQGDPLSLFLFILVMEGLHVALKDAHQARLIKGVSSEEVVSLASLTGCSPGNLPFKYLGLPIGANMNQVSNWNTLVDRFRTKLSSWKANLLSIGDRLTLIKSVLGSIGIYYMSKFKVPETVNKLLEKLRATFFLGGDNENRKTSWINWPQVLAPKAHVIHGEDGGLISTHYSMHGTWANVVLTIHDLHNNNIIPNNSMRIKLGCGSKLIVGLTIDGIGIGEDTHRGGRMGNVTLILTQQIQQFIKTSMRTMAMALV
ncbi:RNA-directed DNA polymerase, eukaryota, reverse transcriptase zinc-binding domain protein [Tanacetum coccineum]|uniref:RNA-directed DNA polymerase, eukaryota, reverse transcriptase zinc-binding domain protein n=1 Tax=Tanacetum coccineum TaxID=301880 RepID=A0ABQ5F942_9ASTR